MSAFIILSIVLKREALLERFKTIDNIMNADIQQLSEADGIGEELARRIYEYFKEKI